ncbi:hypothetical protein ACFFRR_004275 [Megaselia abdita]
MYSIRVVTLVVLLGVGISQGLQCYQCVDGIPDGCDKPALVTCQPKNADFQIDNLEFLFDFNKPKPSENYQCFSYESEIDFGDGKELTRMRGCIYQNYEVCKWSLKKGLTEKANTRKCSVCNKDGCNSQ